MSDKQGLWGLYFERPSLDVIVSLLAVLVWFLLGAVIPEDAYRVPSYLGVSAAAGIGLAAAVFVASQLFGSTARLVRETLEQFSDLVGKNWVHILTGMLLSTVLPVVGIVMDGLEPRLSFGATIFSFCMLLLGFSRVIRWFAVILTVERVSKLIGPPTELELRPLNESDQ